MIIRFVCIVYILQDIHSNITLFWFMSWQKNRHSWQIQQISFQFFAFPFRYFPSFATEEMNKYTSASWTLTITKNETCESCLKRHWKERSILFYCCIEHSRFVKQFQFSCHFFVTLDLMNHVFFFLSSINPSKNHIGKSFEIMFEHWNFFFCVWVRKIVIQ